MFDDSIPAQLLKGSHRARPLPLSHGIARAFLQRYPSTPNPVFYDPCTTVSTHFQVSRSTYLYDQSWQSSFNEFEREMLFSKFFFFFFKNNITGIFKRDEIESEFLFKEVSAKKLWSKSRGQGVICTITHLTISSTVSQSPSGISTSSNVATSS